MDFIVQLPWTKSGYDAIVIFVDCLTKITITEPITTNATAPEIARIFFKSIFCQYGLPQVIVSDHDLKFTSHFW